MGTKTKLSMIVEGEIAKRNKPKYFFADDADISRGYFSDWLKGNVEDPRDEILHRLEKSFKMKHGELAAHSKRRGVITPSGGTLALKKVYEMNPNNKTEVNELLIEAAKKEIDNGVWKKILEMVKG